MKTATTRLMWKEFRAQRDLWLALLIGGSCIQAFFLFIFSRSQRADMTIFLGVTGSWSLMATFAFTLAATAIAFAGEVDDRTAMLLRMLPCSTRQLMTAKLMAVFFGTLGLLASLAVVLCILIVSFQVGHTLWPGTIGRLSLHWGYWGTQGAGPIPLFLLIISFSIMFTGTNLVSSLLTRKVTTAAAAGITGVILLTWAMAAFATLAKNRNFDPDGGFQIACTAVGGVLFLLAFSQLAGRWHRGLLPFPERMRFEFTAPNTQTTSRRRRFRISLPLCPGRTFFQRIASRPESSGRQTAMLAAQTLSAAMPMAVRWLAVSVVLFVAGCFVNSSFFPLPLFLLVFFIHECGQKTFRDDQRTGAFLMLSNIGISPLRIWFVRTTIWFGVMLAVAVVFVALDALVPGFRLSPSESQTIYDQPILHCISPLVMQTQSPTAALSLAIGICLGGILGVFGSGQLMACWIRRQLLAFAGSWMLQAFLFNLLWLMIVGFGWSVWLTLLPVSVCLFLATAATARYWMDRRVTWRLRCYQVAWIIGPALVFGMLAWENWYHVPVINPARAFQIRRDAPVTYGIGHPVSELEPWTQVAVAVAELKSTISPRPNLDPNSPGFNLRFAAGLTREQLKPIVDHLQRLDDLPASQAAIPSRWMAPWTPAVVCILLEDARLLQEAGDGTGALRQLVRAARFGRRLSYQTSSWQGWKTCLRFERLALGRLMVVLGEVDLSNADLRKLIDDLLPPNDSTSSIKEMLNHREAFFALAATQEGRRQIDQQLSEDPQRIAAVAEIMSVNPRADDFGALSDLSDAEGLRAWKVMLLSGEYLRSTALGRLNYHIASPISYSSSISMYTPSLVPPAEYSFLPTIHEQIQDYARGVWIGDELEDFLIAEKAQILMDTIALERAAVLTIRLHQFRFEHGNFPKYLWELPSVSQPYDNDPRTVRFVDHLDPWTGTLFAYAPQGTGKPFPLDRSPKTGRPIASISDEQPILISQTSLYGLPIGEVATEPVVALPGKSIVLCGLTQPAEWINWQPAPKPESQP